MCIESDASVNEDFNLSTPVSTSVLELAKLIWQKIHGDNLPFSYVSDEPFKYDVQMRVPATEKAERLLGFKAETTLAEILDEVIPWITEQVRTGGI